MEIKNDFFEKIETAQDIEVASKFTKSQIETILLYPKVFISITDKQRDYALDRLSDRIALDCENPYDILQIDAKHSYYVNKILSKLTPMTDLIYYRIVGKLPFTPTYFCHLHRQDPCVIRLYKEIDESDLERIEREKKNRLLDYALGVKSLSGRTTEKYKFRDKNYIDGLAQRHRDEYFDQHIQILEDLGHVIDLGTVVFLRAIYNSMSETSFENSTHNLRLRKETISDYISRMAEVCLANH